MEGTEITTKANRSRETDLTKVPKLTHGHDVERAAQLEGYISEAESGLRSILQAGFFLECLAADLPHGKLGPWVEAHCRERSWRTVRRWKQVAASVGEAVGIKLEKERIALKLHEVLALPLAKVPEAVKPIREKIDAEIAGKSYRQLFLQFKQSEDGEAPKHGRRVGEGADHKPTDLDGAIAHRRKLAMQRVSKIYSLIRRVGIDFTLLKDSEIELLLAQYEKHSRALNAWLNQPKGKRDVEAVKNIWEK